MRNTLFLFVFSLFTLFGFSQTDRVWKSVEGKKLDVFASAKRDNFPVNYTLKQLDFNTVSAKLKTAPTRTSGDYSNVIISIPNSEGNLEDFRIYEASNFDATLQAQYPQIRAYVGEGITDKTAIVRLSLDPRGIQTMTYRADKPTEFIEPYAQDNVYAIYNTTQRKGKLPFTCSTPAEQKLTADLSNRFSPHTNKSSTGQLLTFRLALSCTAEYANYFGATSAAQSALVLAAYNATMTRVNGIFERDLAIHMNIIATTTNVIYYDPATDPYATVPTTPPITVPSTWNSELQSTLTSTIGEANYDIGHLFGASGGGGNAGCIGCVCVDGQKGSGITSPANNVPQGDLFDVDYVAHEMGHQFGANHTFSNTNEGSGVNMEVGSGTTIMGYAGITNYDTDNSSLDVFHAASINQIQTNMASKTCPTTTAITHGAPVVNAGADYTVPKSTPFMLTGSATDAGGGNLTYTWEQYDNSPPLLTGASSAASETKTSGPNWKNYKDSSSPTRYFPIMSSVFAGSTTTAGVEITAEALSSVARTLNFRLTARDNVAGQGQTGYDDMAVNVSGFFGPLTVTSQNTDQLVWTPGATETITWTVNGTNSITGGANVDILYTTDEGVTWTPIVTNVANDGSEAITVPSVTAPNCRVMVKASGNIFFNVNSKNIAIGDYTYQTQNICEDYTFNLNLAIDESTDNSYPGTALTISDSFIITDIKTHVDITHPNIGQVNVLFWFPWSASLNTGIWYDETSCTNANMDKWFDNAGVTPTCSTVGGNAFKPLSTGNFSGAVGQNSAGEWRVYFKDVVVDNSGGTFNTFTIQLCQAGLVPVLSENAFETNDFAIYPNPNNGTFNLQLNASSEKVAIDIHDLRGRLMLSKEVNGNGLVNETIELQNAQTGIYLVTIKDGASKTTKKIVVK